MQSTNHENLHVADAKRGKTSPSKKNLCFSVVCSDSIVDLISSGRKHDYSIL